MAEQKCPGQVYGNRLGGCDSPPSWRVFDPSDGEELAFTCDQHLPTYIRQTGWTEVGVEVFEADEAEEDDVVVTSR